MSWLGDSTWAVLHKVGFVLLATSWLVVKTDLAILLNRAGLSAILKPDQMAEQFEVLDF